MILLAGTNNPPLELTWEWGDGVTASARFVAPYVEHFAQHTYIGPGANLFRAESVDAFGLRSEYTGFVISTLPTINVFDLNFGRELRDYAVYTPAYTPISAPNTGVHAVLASGASGLVVARTMDAAVTYAARLDPAFPIQRTAVWVEVDDANDLAYLAAGDAGVYVVDVSDAAEPKALYPYRFVAPNQNALDTSRLWLCGENRVYILDRGNAIYAIQLTSVTALAALRANPDLLQSPWDYVRAVTGDADSPALSLPHPAARDFACIDDKTVVVADQRSFSVYDLSTFFGAQQSPSLLRTYTIQLNFPDTPLADIVSMSIAQQGSAGPVTAAFALAENGSVEYRLTPTGDDVAVSLYRHRVTLRGPSAFSGSGFVSERHASVSVAGPETFVFVDGLQNADALLLFDNTAAGALTETIVYDAGEICTPASAQFSGRKSCRLGVGYDRVRIPDAQEGVWVRAVQGLQRLRRVGNGFLSEIYDLPLQPTALALSPDEYWVFAGGQLVRFSRQDVEIAVPTALQAQPLSVTEIGFRVDRVVGALTASDELLLVGDGEIAWFDIQERTLLAQRQLDHGIYDVAFDRPNRLGQMRLRPGRDRLR